MCNRRGGDQLEKQLQASLQKRCIDYVTNTSMRTFQKSRLKTSLMEKRKAEIVHVKAKGKIIKQVRSVEGITLDYKVHVQYLIKQEDLFYIEEEIEYRSALFKQHELIKDEEIPYVEQKEEHVKEIEAETGGRMPFIYDRTKAVQYAERWWNERNPAYPEFENNCTHYISQCLRAGGAPMRGAPNRSKGWWFSGKSWSYSWSVANALYLYLKDSTVGLRTKELSSPEELMLGDIICYDFEGDGKFNHNTIVTAKDHNGMPLVNANTTDSRLRYWSYEDSTAYTPNIQYRFFHIVDDYS